MGLCLKCDEKHIHGHQLFLIEGVWDDDDTTDIKLTKDMLEEDSNEVLAISLNALMGASTMSTMILFGRILGQQVAVLIDSRSSHNFLNLKIIPKLKMPLQSDKELKVHVTNGEKMQCRGRCQNLVLELPVYKLNTDFFALQIKKNDVVLGIHG